MNFVTNIDWNQVASVLVISGTIMGGLLAAMRWKLGTYFVTRSDQAKLFQEIREENQGLSHRLKAVEQAVTNSPRAEDVQALTARVARIETDVAVTASRTEDVQRGVARMEHMLSLLTQHLLDRERAPQ